MPRLLSLIALLLFALPAHSQQAERGLMLGIQWSEIDAELLPYQGSPADSLPTPQLETLFLVPESDSLTLIQRAPSLYVPRTDTLWQIGIKRSIYNDWLEDFLWTRPLGGRHDLPGIAAFNGEHCEGHQTVRLLFVRSGRMGVRQQRAGYCDGAAHPWSSETLAVLPIDSVGHLGLTVREVLGQRALRTFQEATQDTLGAMALVEREEYADPPDEANWSLAHLRGRWRMVVRLAPAGQLNTPPPVEFATDYTLRTGASSMSWEMLQKSDPLARDVLFAPSGRLALVVRSAALVARRLEEGTLTDSLASVPLPEGAEIIFARWAAPDQVRSWAAAVPSSDPTPRL